MRALTGLLAAGLLTLACASSAHAQGQTGQVGFLSQRDATGNSLNFCDVQVFAIPLTIHNPCHVMETVDQYNVPHPIGPSNPMPISISGAIFNGDGGLDVHVTNPSSGQTITGSVSVTNQPSNGAQEAGGHLASVDTSTAADAANNAAFQGAVNLTVGTAVTGSSIGRSIAAICTVAGTAEFQFPDSSNLTVPVQVGFQTFPFAVNEVLSSGTTATCAYSNLK